MWVGLLIGFIEEFKWNVAFKLRKGLGGAVQWVVVRNMALEHKREVKAAGKSIWSHGAGCQL